MNIILQFKLMFLGCVALAVVFGLMNATHHFTETYTTAWTGSCEFDRAKDLDGVTLVFRCGDAGEPDFPHTQYALIRAVVNGVREFDCEKKVGAQSERINWTCAAPEEAE